MKPLRQHAHIVQNGQVAIYLHEKYRDDCSHGRAIVLAHGSASAGRESFDLQVPGIAATSLMDVLAQEGFDVFAIDVRGFGRSTKPGRHIFTSEAGDDLNAAVDYILALRSLSKVDLLAWSWGTQYAGMFIAAYAHKVSRYVACSQMHAASRGLIERRARAEEFRNNHYVAITEDGWKQRFYAMTPRDISEAEIVDAFAGAAMQAAAGVPSGPQLDLIGAMPMLEPGVITVPVMLIHGEYDDVADTAGLLPFFQALPNPDKRYVVIPEAGHMIMLQKGRHAFHRAVIGFFEERQGRGTPAVIG